MANSSSTSNFKSQWTVAVLFWATILHLFTCVAMQDQKNNSQLMQPTDTSPRLSFRPMPGEPNKNNSIIQYHGTRRESFDPWIKQLDKFLEVYRNPNLTTGRSGNMQECNYDNPPKPGKVCEVDVKHWFPCNTENNYNYHKSAPCIFLKLNTISNWVPEYYNDTADLPDRMPPSLKDHILSRPANQLNTVWVSCEGENPADIENIGPIDYIPRWGFPGYFYPENSEGHLSPLIALHFAQPQNGLLINIECKVWAKNIKHDRADSLGLVHLELMVD